MINFMKERTEGRIIIELGEIRKNNHGTLMKIIRIRNKSDIDVQFIDDIKYVKEHTNYQNFLRGQIKNPYDKSMYGIGYLGVGKYKASVNCIHTQENDAWKCMMERCYCGERKEHMKYFESCDICDEWLNFQNFAEWYCTHKYPVNERLHVDKDILFPGNKTYSPSNCLLVPQRINMLFLNKPNKRGLPNGIIRAKSGYLAKYNQKELGIFNTIDEAFFHYAKAKEKKIKEVANEYKNIIPEEVYQALLKYRVDIVYDKNYIAS